MKKSRIAVGGRRIAGVLVLVLALAMAPAARAAENAVVLKRQMLDFERTLTLTLAQMFENRPFAVLQEPKSVYLPGFGAVLHTEVNLYPMRFLLPFDQPSYSEKEIKTEREQMIQRLKELETRLRELLLAQSTALAQLGGHENIAIVIHLFNPRQVPEIPGQVVAQARRQALLDLQADGRKPAAADLTRVVSLRGF